MLDYKKRGFSKFSPPRKIFASLFLIFFVASVIFIVVPMNGGAGWGNIGVWFPSVYFLLLFSATYNLERLKKILKKAYRPMILIFYSGMILFLAAFTVFCVLILGYSSDVPPENPDLIIVLGCQVKGENPGNLLKYRLETSADVLNKYPDAFCIVSGGQGPDEIIQESRVMKKYLVNKNIDQNRIFEEDKSSSSFQNLTFSKKIIEENNLNHKNIILVTSEYHVPRAALIAKRIYPDANIYSVKSKTPFALFSAGIVREFFAFVKSYIFDKV